MQSFNINGVTVDFVNIDDASEEEAKNYIDYVQRRFPDDSISNISVSLCDDGLVDVNYQLHGQSFERIRRITGYLVGSLDRWNDSKQAEEHDRVKHGKFKEV